MVAYEVIQKHDTVEAICRLHGYPYLESRGRKAEVKEIGQGSLGTVVQTIPTSPLESFAVDFSTPDGMVRKNCRYNEIRAIESVPQEI